MVMLIEKLMADQPLENKEQRKYPRKMSLPWALMQNTPALAKRLLHELKQGHGSDLHITPDDGNHRVSLRKNGVLEPLFTVSSVIGLELVNHWKAQANLDLTLTHKPQDGAILNSKTEEVSYRISTCPTLFGEKIVIRLHSTSLSAISIKQLGATSSQLSHILRAVQNRSGLVLISGPTGSGKTNTIYAILNHLKKQQLNIVSVEDPVEINLPGITQICTNEAFGFPQALRTILRQDPNVIMIGEIRDTETAKIALSAAQTGHLVIASVHAGNSFSALQRMHDLGVDTKELIPQLLLLTSQQLIRTTANHLDTSHEDYYQNRRGVFDVIACTPLIQQQLLAEHEKNNLAEFIADHLAKENDYSDSILMNLLKEGQTDWSELQRVYGWNKAAKLSAQYKA